MKTLAIHPTGSWFTCEPPVLDTDRDYIVLVDGCIQQALADYLDDGWVPCDHEGARIVYALEEGYGQYWFAARRYINGVNENHIVTNSEVHYLRSLGATLVCKQLNLLDKEERIKLFRCIKFEESYEGRYE